jgi:hypothetical protein
MNRNPTPGGVQQPPVFFNTILFAILFVFLYVYLIILPSVEMKLTGFQENLKNASKYSYLDEVVIYVVNLLQMTIVLLVLIGILIFYGTFDCTQIAYPIVFGLLFLCAMMSFTFFLRTLFNSGDISFYSFSFLQSINLFLIIFQLFLPQFVHR